MSATIMTVCGTAMSPEASRAMTCLFEKDIQFRNIPKLIGAGVVQVEQSENSLLKFGEAREFCRYICDKYPEKGNRELYGRNLLAKESIDEWIETEYLFEVHSASLVYHLAIRPQDREFMDHKRQYEHRFDYKMEELGKVLDMYEKRLGESRFLGGDEFSLADLFHLPHIQYLLAAPKVAPLFTSPNVSRWWNDISSRHSWNKILHLQQKLLDYSTNATSSV